VEWRLRLRSLVDARVAFAVVVLGFVLSQAPSVVRSVVDSARTSEPSVAKREQAPADAIGVPNDLLANAARVIPLDATYAVVVGQTPPTPAPLDIGVPALVHFWLFPRRWRDDVHGVDWVVAFHQSSEALGVRVRREIGLSEAANAVEVGG
jgi:hypothetical protein